MVPALVFTLRSSIVTPGVVFSLYSSAPVIPMVKLASSTYTKAPLLAQVQLFALSVMVWAAPVTGVLASTVRVKVEPSEVRVTV